MKNMLDGIEEVLLMGPGPSCVPPQVYEAIGKKTLGHLDPYFLKIMDDLKEHLRTLLNTKNNLTVPISGTGSAGMEACFVNLVEPGDKVLVLINGVFGVRMREVASRLGAEVDALEFIWGTPVVVDDVAKKLKEKTYRIVAVVHAETSTGVCNPVEEIGALLKGSDTIYLVDTVTSLGGIEVRMDDWGIDALYSGTQKCLSCPPGLAPLSFSDKAMARLGARKTRVPNWYLDISLIANYWSQNRVYHHTAPVNMVYALYQALLLILEEGPVQVFKRHRDTHQMLVKGLEGMGLKMVVDKTRRLPMLNTAYCPEGIDDLPPGAAFAASTRSRSAAGSRPWPGRSGASASWGTRRRKNVERFLDALRKVIS
jgi:alanine-glyoxylate transaminase/serine-glyoxylate transaminase/serine-pyruvate transaminase